MDNKLKIINYLGKHPEEVFTMRELSQQTNIPYATFHRTLKEMKDLVQTRVIGKSTTVALKIGNPIMKSYLAIGSEEEKKEFIKKQPFIHKIASELNTKEITLLFGSYAKGTHKETSDVDLLIIHKGEKSLSFSKYETLFKKKINPLFITKLEFKKMLKDKEENVGKQALKDHILLNNPEGFWECVLHG
ncbi:MAG: nucleotidyltransferase domain-containing protein [Nanoarchaeota archaeon]